MFTAFQSSNKSTEFTEACDALPRLAKGILCALEHSGKFLLPSVAYRASAACVQRPPSLSTINILAPQR
ncbi:hypothetical protein ACTXT7_008793 [Hymenolepis weldensis]